MKKIYTVDSDGIIEFVAEEFEEQRRMFAAAGLDIGLIRTEKDYEKAFKAAGDYFFGTLVQSAEVGDKAGQGALQTFLSGRTSDFLATIRRGAFKLIDGDRARLEAEIVEDLFLDRYDPAKAARLEPAGRLVVICSEGLTTGKG
jgi:hypothetical protein